MTILIGASENSSFSELVAVKSLAEARRDWLGFDMVVTIEDSTFTDGLRISNSKVPQAVFRFDDLDRIGGSGVAPTENDVALMIGIGRQARGKKLLVHCHQGQSRSAAVALSIIADRLGRGREREAVEKLMEIRPSSVCNLMILALADKFLKRDGALLKAWNDFESSNDKASGIRLLRGLAEQQGKLRL